MKLNPKKIAILLAAGFLAFAPPGTLIFLALIIVGLFGKTGLIIVVVIAIAVLIFFIVKKKQRQTLKQSEQEK